MIRDEKKALLVEQIASIVAALIDGDKQRADRQMEQIAFHPAQLVIRPSLSPGMKAKVWMRDNFTCRYCESRTIPPIVLQVLSSMYTNAFPYHPNWKTIRTHPAYWKVSASVDHVKAGSIGGDWRSETNLVTACWSCNQMKSNVDAAHGVWNLLDVAAAGWDGLTGSYPILWRIAGEPEPAKHRPWLRVFAANGPESKS